jgi:hypothetical protein
MHILILLIERYKNRVMPVFDLTQALYAHTIISMTQTRIMKEFKMFQTIETVV